MQQVSEGVVQRSAHAEPVDEDGEEVQRRWGIGVGDLGE